MDQLFGLQHRSRTDPMIFTKETPVSLASWRNPAPITLAEIRSAGSFAEAESKADVGRVERFR